MKIWYYQGVTMEWKKVREYADDKKITTGMVYKKIKRKTLLSKKIDGVIYVADLTAQQAEHEQQQKQAEYEQQNLTYQDQLKKKLQLENALKIEKLKNLQQDTLIKKQKQTFTKQKYRQEYVQGVFQAFTESFANIKNLIIQLKLSRQNNNKFKRIFAQCIKKFEINLKKYLSEADKKELEQNEADKVE